VSVLAFHLRENPWLRTMLFAVGGALVGYLYHRVVGCRSGACPITASPYTSSLYGAAMGFLVSRS